MNPIELTTPVERHRPDSRISYAQNGEDVLLDRLFHNRPGTFVDVGGNHPFIDNNTYFFYLRGWRGVSLEPSRRGFALFGEYRPDDLNLQVAASDADGEHSFYEIDGADGLTGLSTLSAGMAETHRADGYTVAEHRVPVRTVASLIAEHRIAPPDLMSIDVEGHEAAVIRGVPLADWRPRAFVIESTIPLTGAPTHQEWEPILLEHGYHFAAFNGVNRFYLRDDLREALPLFATPVSILDRYYRHETVALQNRVDEYRNKYERAKADHAFDLANLEKLREAWEWGRVQSQHAQAVWQQERDSFAKERVAWKEAFDHFHATEAHFKDQQAAWERERTAWQAEREEHHAQIAQLQVLLRPYQLLDRLRVVPAGFRLAGRIKRKLAS